MPLPWHPELQSGAGDLSDKRLLPSAYEVWDGPRPNGYLRVRYAYDVPKLQELLPDHVVACKPLHLDDETIEWMTTHIKSPCPRPTACQSLASTGTERAHL